MTIERDGWNGPIAMHCDGCPDAAETHCTDFAGALAKMKSRGWTVQNVGGQWRHLCPACAEGSDE